MQKSMNGGEHKPNISSAVPMFFKQLKSDKAIAISNPVLFQINWFFCIFAPLQIALLSTLLLLLYHFLLVTRKAYEWRMMLGFSIAGFLCDSVIASMNWMHFSNSIALHINGHTITLAPLWLLLLWLSFSTCLNHALVFLQARKLLCLAMIIAFVPFNYALGARLTESSFVVPSYWVLTAISCYWMMLLPFFLQRLKQKKADNIG